MQRTIVFAKHDGCEKEFIFEVPEGMTVKNGDILLVDTIKGKQLATATDDMSTGEYSNKILMELGAYLPLKMVLSACCKEIKDYITEDTVYKVINAMNQVAKVWDTLQDVVRCKDCKYLMFSECYGECSKAIRGIVMPDDFCGLGERRDTNDR